MTSTLLGFCSTPPLNPFKFLASRPLRRSATRQLSQTPIRASHIGSKPINIPPTVSLSVCNPIRPRTNRTFNPHGNAQVTVTGPLGRLAIDLAPFVRLMYEDAAKTSRLLGAHLPPTPLASPSVVQGPDDSQVPADSVSGSGLLRVTVEDEKVKPQRGVWGLTRALVANAVQGVTDGFTSSLELVGVGYRAALEDVPPLPGTPPEAIPKRKRLNLRVGYSHPVLIELPETNTFLSCEVPAPNKILLKGIDKQELGLLAAVIRKWRPPEPYNGKGIYLNGEVIKRKESKKK